MKKYWKHAVFAMLGLFVLWSLACNAIYFCRQSRAGVYDKGFVAGKKEGFTSGYKDGYDAGNEEGHTAGFEDGKKAGIDLGKVDGAKTGFADGAAKIKDQIMAEIIRQYGQGLLTISDNNGTVYKFVPKK